MFGMPGTPQRQAVSNAHPCWRCLDVLWSPPQRRPLFRLRSWGVLGTLTWKCASRHNGVQFFISPLASWLRTRRFSEPTFQPPSGASNHWKNSVLRLSYLFAHLDLLSSFFWLFLFLLTLSLSPDSFSFSWLFLFLLTLSLSPDSFSFSWLFLFLLTFSLSPDSFSFSWLFLLLFSSLLFSDFSDSSHLCFSSVHIVGSFASKLPFGHNILFSKFPFYFRSSWFARERCKRECQVQIISVLLGARSHVYTRITSVCSCLNVSAFGMIVLWVVLKLSYPTLQHKCGIYVCIFLHGWVRGASTLTYLVWQKQPGFAVFSCETSALLHGLGSTLMFYVFLEPFWLLLYSVAIWFILKSLRMEICTYISSGCICKTLTLDIHF